MRVILLTGGFAGPNRDPWLLDDLASELIAAGHEVDVVVTDARYARPRGLVAGTANTPTVFSVGTTTSLPSARARLVEHLRIAVRLHTTAFSWVRTQRYDLCIYTSPAFLSWGFPRRLRRKGVVACSLLFLWDFFPIHHVEIGRVRPAWLSPMLKFLERASIVGADFVALMTPANTKFFRDYHRNIACQTLEIPPWSGATPAPPSQQQGGSKLRVVFGGQLARGRGVDTLLRAASELQDISDEFEVFIAGDGPERSSLEHLAQQQRLTNVTFLGALPREQYRELATTMHLGVAITVPGVSAPSFPSKIVEYCGLGLPVLVCVEPASDAGELITRYQAGFTAPVGDPGALAAALRQAIEAQRSGALADIATGARELFTERLSVKAAVEKLSATVQGTMSGGGAGSTSSTG